jgi:glyoxylate/hydroxypyruvate reductase A
VALTVLIASPLEEELVAELRRGAPDGVRIVHERTLLPLPRWPGDHVGILPTLAPAELARWRDLLAEAEVCLDADWLEPERLPVNAPRLRWIQSTSAGVGEFLSRTGLDVSGIRFTTAAGIHAVPLAEHVVLALLYFSRDVPGMIAAQRAGRWERVTAMPLAGRRMLVVGLGHIGRRVAQVCSAMGMEVWAMRRRGGETVDGVDRLITRESLHEVLPLIDALVVTAPLTVETHHLIGRTELTLLPPTALIVNVGRGAVIDEPELIAALQEGRLAGAALDVFETEPLPADSPLWDLPNVLVTPHTATGSVHENALIVRLFLDNLQRYLDGRPLLNVFDPATGY